MPDVTHILNAIEAGDRQAAEQLLPLVYDELRKLAASKMAREKPGHTLGATELVHEAYLRLIGPGDEPRWQNRGHFFAAAAEAMRRVLVDRARRKARPKHGGDRIRENLEPVVAEVHDCAELLALHGALERFEAVAPRKARLVKLRYFAGCTLPEIAAMLGIGQSTAEADWTYAKAWLKREIEKKLGV